MQQKTAYGYALTAVFFWSTVATAFKVGLRYVTPEILLLWASASSTLILFVVVFITGNFRKFLSQSRKDFFRSAVLGALNPFLYYLILFEAYNRLPGQVAQPLNMIWPVVLAFLAAPFLKQKITIRNIVALLVSFLGVLWISSQGELFNPLNSDVTGVILATGSSVIWSFYWIGNLRDPRDEEIKLLSNFLFALVYILLWTGIRGTIHFPPVKGLLAGIYSGLFEMGITFFLWLKALRVSRSAAAMGNLVFLAPFVSLVFLHFIAGETIYITTLAGLLFILTGIFIQNYNHGTKKK